MEGLRGGVYESTVKANGRLSVWNSKAVVVDKVPHPRPENELRVTFNYRNVDEEIPAHKLERMDEVMEYLGNPSHRVFMQADLKHAYYSVPLHRSNRHIYAFSIDGIGQLQPTRMPQGCAGAPFTMSSLMSLALKPIPEPHAEPSLLHPTTVYDTAPCQFYIDDIVAGSKSFDDLFFFLEHHFLPRVAWAGLRLSFMKLRLFVPEVIALGVHLKVGGHLKVTTARTEKLSKWPAPQNKRDVRGFWGPSA